MSLQIYLNGSWVSKEDAKVSIWDHGFLYGDGIFEGIRVYNGRVFRLDDHLDRLYASARGIALEIPMPQAQMRQNVIETVRRNELTDAYIRLVVSRGTGDLGLDPRKCREATVVILADKISLYSDTTNKRGIRVMIASTRRTPPDSLNGRVKSLNYLNNILAKIEHIKAGFDESLMLNHDGYLVEATAENVFLVKGKKLLTPPCHLGALEGITRATVMQLAPSLGYEVEEALLNPHDLYVCDECFLTGTGAEIVAVVEADGRPIGDGKPGRSTLEILDAFHDYAQKDGVPVYLENDSPQGQTSQERAKAY